MKPRVWAADSSKTEELCVPKWVFFFLLLLLLFSFRPPRNLCRSCRPTLSVRTDQGWRAHLLHVCLLPLSSPTLDASLAANQSQTLASISRPSASRKTEWHQRTETFPWFRGSGASAISQPDKPHIFSLTWKITVESLDLPQTQNPPLQKKKNLKNCKDKLVFDCSFLVFPCRLILKTIPVVKVAHSAHFQKTLIDAAKCNRPSF